MPTTQVAPVNGLTDGRAEADTVYWLWRRRSVRVRLLVSWIVSWGLHGCIILLLVWGGKTLATKKGEPPRVDVVAAVGESAGAPGFGDDGIAPGADNGLFGPPPAGSETAASPTNFLPDATPSAVSDSLPKVPDVELPGADIVGSMLSGRGGILGGTDDGRGGGAGGQGGGGGTGASGLGAGWTNTQFFGTTVWGSKFVFVIDRSGSMSQRDRLGTAKRELLASLANLPPESQFQIIFYNLRPEAILQPKVLKLHYVTDQNRVIAMREMDKLIPDGGTEHLPALKMALSMKPDVVFFLTDADDLRAGDVKQVTELNKGRANIHTIEFAIGPEIDRENMLRELASANGGTYRYIDVTKLGQTVGEERR